MVHQLGFNYPKLDGPTRSWISMTLVQIRCPASIFVVLRSSTARFRCVATPCRDVATLGRSLLPLYIFSRVSTLTLVSWCPLPLASRCFLLCLDVFCCVSMFSVVSLPFPLRLYLFLCVSMFSDASRCFLMRLDVFCCVSMFSVASRRFSLVSRRFQLRLDIFACVSVFSPFLLSI